MVECICNVLCIPDMQYLVTAIQNGKLAMSSQSCAE
jgi:hypothetical protein